MSVPTLSTYYFWLSKAARGTSWKTNSNQGGATYPQISRYVTAFPWFGLVTFGNDTSGVSLSSRLSTRPVVKSAYFNVQRWNDGGFGNGYGNLFLGRYTGSFTATNPDYTKCNFTYSASKNWSGSGSALRGRIPITSFLGPSLLAVTPEIIMVLAGQRAVLNLVATVKNLWTILKQVRCVCRTLPIRERLQAV